MAPHAVAAGHFALGCRQQQGLHIVFKIQPIPHVGAIAIERDWLACGRLEDHHRDQPLGELSGAVVVGAVGEHHRQAVGVVPGVHQVIARGFAGRVGAARVVGGGFREYAFRGRDAPAQDCTPDGPSLSDQAAVLCVAELRAPAAVMASPHRGDGQSRPAPGTARHRGPVA